MLISFLLGFLPLSWEIKMLYKFHKVRKFDPALKWTHWILPIAAVVWGVFWMYQFVVYLGETRFDD